MIKLEIKRNEDGKVIGFRLFANEPVRLEVGSFKEDMSSIIGHIYQGTKINMQQEPVGCFDGTLKSTELTDWQIKA